MPRKKKDGRTKAETRWRRDTTHLKGKRRKPTAESTADSGPRTAPRSASDERVKPDARRKAPAKAKPTAKPTAKRAPARTADVPTEALKFSVPKGRIAHLAGEPTAEMVARLKMFGDLLLEHATKMSLVSRHELSRLHIHVLDSAALLSTRELPTGDAWTADLGTGGGLPGVVLAILRPESKIALVDSRRSRVVFLKIVKRELKLDNVEIVHERIEDLAGARKFELCVARALGKIEKILVPSLDIVAPGGSLVLFKGPKWQTERTKAVEMAQSVGAELAGEQDVEIRGEDRSTTFVEFKV
jgi:16S rRNA (guanine527-N7)-methyltransferase